MAAKRGYDRGNTLHGPLRTKFKAEGQAREFEDTIFRWNPRMRVDEFIDFTAEASLLQYQAPIIKTAGNADINAMPVTNAAVARAYFRVQRAGIITGISVVAEDAMVQNGTDFLTFTALNLQTAGDGNRALLVTTAHHNTTDINAVALNAGADLTAKVIWPLELTATTASLYVKAGDLIEVTVTGSGTPAAVDAPHCFLTIQSIAGLKPTPVQVGGATTNVPIAVINASSANGEALLQLSATNEAQSVRLDLGDQLLIPATRAAMFACRIKMSAAPSAVQRAVIGLASQYTATLDNIIYNAWFRIDGGNSASVIDVRCETDDATTDRDDQSSGSTTLTADTYYVLTVDLFHKPGKAIFWVDDNIVAELDCKDFAVGHVLQPFILLQKDSGTGVPSLTVDYVRYSWSRI